MDNLTTKPGVRYISLFSGMEAASAALERIGCPCTPVAFADIDDAAAAVLAHKWPDVPNHGDVTSFDWSVYRGKVDICFGGSPCQSFSVAGNRLGITDPRGNLALHYLRVVAVVRPRWFIYENVPGLLSSGKGDDFKSFLAAVEEIGYSCSWRIVDARYCGVPQRRKRIWVVGHLGEWVTPATVLLEPKGEGRDPLAGATAWKEAPRRAGTGVDGGLKPDPFAFKASHYTRGKDGAPSPVAFPLTADADRDAQGWNVNADYCVTSQGDLAACLRAQASRSAQFVTYDAATIYDMRGNGDGDLCPTLMRGCAGDRPTDYTPCIDDTWRLGGSQPKWVVRRLTPLECVRLQGFPDTWLDGVQLRGKPLADSHKYKLVGNSWAVPCAAFLADRIRTWDRLYVGRMMAAAKEVEAVGLVVYGTAEWGVAGFHDDEAPLGVLFVDDDGWRVIDRDGRTPLGFDALPVTIGECLALIAAASVFQVAA